MYSVYICHHHDIINTFLLIIINNIKPNNNNVIIIMLHDGHHPQAKRLHGLMYRCTTHLLSYFCLIIIIIIIRITTFTEDTRETTFTFQRLSMALQRGNAVGLLPEYNDHRVKCRCFYNTLLINILYLRELSTEGLKK